jgi:hypothetical protein
MPKATLVTRTSTTSSVTEDNLNKGSALTHAEMDSNLINLRNSSWGLADDTSTTIQVSNDKTITIAGGTGITTSIAGDTLTINGVNQAQGITVVGDDSTGTVISDGETIKIAGTQNIITAMSGDTLTITGPDLSSYITNSTITVVGDDSTGTVFNTGETIKIAGGTGVTTAVSGDTLTITAAGGGGLSNVVEDTTPQLGGNLDINSNDITGTGNISITGNIANDAVSITDNSIKATRSNDNLYIDVSGTGVVTLGDTKPLKDSILAPFTMTGDGRMEWGVNQVYSESLDLDSLNSSSQRRYVNNRLAAITLTGSGSGSSSERIRQGQMIQIETDGNNTAYDHAYHQSLANVMYTEFRNSSASTSTIQQATGISAGVGLDANAGDISITDAVSMSAYGYINGANDVDITNWYGQLTGIIERSGAGTHSITNYYGVYVDDQESSRITNPYGVYVKDADYSNVLGGVTLQSGDITTPAITIADNKISTNRSNDDLLLEANGTGMIVSGGQASDLDPNERYGHARYYYEEVDPTTQTTTDDQRRAHHDEASFKISASSANSNARYRNTQSVVLDMAGFDLTATSAQYLSRGPQNGIFLGVDNTSGSSASTLANAQGMQTGIELYNTGGQGLTVNGAVGNSTYINVRSGITVDNGYGYRTFLDNSGTVTNWYAYYAENLDQATNNYAFYTANAEHLSRMGAVILANQAADPAGVTDSSHIYAKDDAGSSEVYVRDEAGNVTKISPHNDVGEWEYYSVNKNTGKTVRVNMEKMIRKLEQLTGETFIENQ